VPRHFFPTKLPGHMAAHTRSPWRHRAPGALCCWCGSLAMAGSNPASPWRPASPCCNPLQFAPQPAPAGRHAQAATSPARASWHSRGSPILTSPAAPRATLALPYLQPFEHLGPAPSSPHGSHLGCPSPQMEPIGNRGHHHSLPWMPPQPLAVEKIEEKIEKLGW